MFKILSTCKGGGYRYARTDPPHPKRNAMGLYPLHRVLMENKLGRLLDLGEDVHHKDDDKTNDDPDNLEVKTKSAHAKHHRKKHITQLIECACAQCACTFGLKPHIYRLRIKRNKTAAVFCSRSCGTSFNNSI